MPSRIGRDQGHRGFTTESPAGKHGERQTDGDGGTECQGGVCLSVVVMPDGRATNIRVEKGLGMGLDERAVEAVKTWRFHPALGPDRKPVATAMTIELTFWLY